MQVEVRDVGFGYSPYPHSLARDQSISLQAKGLFAVYGSFTSIKDPSAYPSEKYLLMLCGDINAKTFRKYKKELIDSGWISQVQQVKRDGRFSTCLITRYADRGLNPYWKGVPTDTQNLDGGFLDVQKLDDKQECLNKLPINKKLLEQQCIEWIIVKTKREGRLKSEEALRSALWKKAEQGKLDMREFLDSLGEAGEGEDGFEEKDRISKEEFRKLKEEILSCFKSV